MTRNAPSPAFGVHRERAGLPAEPAKKNEHDREPVAVLGSVRRTPDLPARYWHFVTDSDNRTIA